MLYYSFRDSVISLHESINLVVESSAPNYGTTPPENVLISRDNIEKVGLKLESIIKELPQEIEGHSSFGPVIDPDDLKVVLSLLFDITLSFDDNCPLRSHYPIVLFKAKVEILMEYINLYSSWKDYYKSPSRVKRGYYSPFLNKYLNDMSQGVNVDSNILEALFNNITSCISQAKDGLEFDLQIKYTDI